MSDNKPKIPDMPDFLKKSEGPVNPPKVTPPPPPVKQSQPTPPVDTTPEVSPVAENKDVEQPKAAPPKEKKRFLFGKKKGKIPLIEFRNDQGEMVPSAAPVPAPPEATLNDYFPPWVGQILAVLLLVATGAGLFYYYQAEGYKSRFQAMDSRVLSFTKEIASLNQENNTLSGKIVNYQKELEGRSDGKAEELQRQVTELQNQLAAGKTPAVTTTTTAPVNGTKAVEAADPVPQQAVAPAVPVQVTTAPKQAVNGTATRPAVPAQRPVPKATDASINYESRLKTKGELSCLQYYKSENLKKCQGRDSKYTAVMIGSKATPQGTKLTYQCQGQGAKPLNFKYGPMEIYNNCAGR